MSVHQILEKIEKENDVKIVFACEAGSRIYGYDNKTSDFDIRFIYIRKKEMYFRFDDTEELVIRGSQKNVEYIGFDIKKALKNISEKKMEIWAWFKSPIIYINTEKAHRIEKILPEYFAKRELFFLYLGYCNKIEKMEIDKPFKIKNFILPALKIVALSQYAETGKFPRSENISFMEQECKADTLMEHISMLSKKRKEGEEYYENTEMLKLLFERWEHLRQEALKIESVNFSAEKAEELFMQMVLQTVAGNYKKI